MTENTEKIVSELVSDKQKFEKFIYTPIEEALTELDKRSKDDSIKSLPSLPNPFSDEPRAVLFRHVATPNYEARRFISIVDGLESLEPLILEYTSDKFFDKNEWKRSLAKIPFNKGIDSNGKIKFENVSVLDFNTNNGKPINEVITYSGQTLPDFHHELFLRIFPDLKDGVFDLSNWLKENGQSARNYYKSFLKIFIKNGILFENFLLEEPELTFNKNIVLPSLIEIESETGLKPLIVSLEPTDTEGDKFWLCHPYEDKSFVLNKIKG
ncbi:MAG: hypothetical protein AB200_00885 [Parcubacteria bacterium C7867-005]|nr:MAG: hypothetical protein AB200_00885 [Parcubacteria bacterium C7867-005]